MNLKERLKNIPVVIFLYTRVSRWYYCLLTCISPELNSRVLYRGVFKKKPDLKYPKTFEEKLLWLKLKKYIHDPLVIQCVDKYAVRAYVKETCGEGVLNDLYGIYDRPDEISWESLPERFVLKWNFGAQYNVICKNKKDLSIKTVRKKLKKWKRKKLWLRASELQYKYVPQKLICEKYLGDVSDYKVYCFHGEPKAILVMHDRVNGIRSEFFDIGWNRLKNTAKYPSPEEATPRPECLEELLDAARKLSKPFPFVRCDFYVVSGRVYFGEMTFTPAGCLYVAKTEIDGKDMTEFLQVP